jgi:hypothetical protein
MVRARSSPGGGETAVAAFLASVARAELRRATLDERKGRRRGGGGALRGSGGDGMERGGRGRDTTTLI